MVENYARLTAADIVRRVREKKIRAVDLAATALSLAETEGRRLNALTAICHDKAMIQAEAIDSMVSEGRDLPPLAGVPIIIKDNISYSDYPTTCGSRMLENYTPVYDATCIEKLIKAGAVVIAKANMDEFAMGSSNENSAFGPAINPACDGYVPGGSSGGSCAAVSAGIVPIALGSDTGGSIRQPAGFCGVVGLKPTYGTISRCGLVAFASSTDQIGPIAKNVADCALAFKIMSGQDSCDATSVPYDAAPPEPADQKLLIGVPGEYMSGGVDPEVKTAVERAIEKMKSDGHVIKEVSLLHTEHAIAVYYIIANAEASSNLARFDGVRYGLSQGREQGLAAMYAGTRSDGFGNEVKRRIMLGTFALSAGYYDAYYGKAQKVRRLISDDFDKVFTNVDIIISPTSPTAAFKFEEKTNDPLAMYLSDILTVPASLAGIPAISIPCGKTSDGRPIGLQLMAPAYHDQKLLTAAACAEKLIGYDHAGS